MYKIYVLHCNALHLQKMCNLRPFMQPYILELYNFFNFFSQLDLSISLYCSRFYYIHLAKKCTLSFFSIQIDWAKYQCLF